MNIPCPVQPSRIGNLRVRKDPATTRERENPPPTTTKLRLCGSDTRTLRVQLSRRLAAAKFQTSESRRIQIWPSSSPRAPLPNISSPQSDEKAPLHHPARKKTELETSTTTEMTSVGQLTFESLCPVTLTAQLLGSRGCAWSSGGGLCGGGEAKSGRRLGQRVTQHSSRHPYENQSAEHGTMRLCTVGTR